MSNGWGGARAGSGRKSGKSKVAQPAKPAQQAERARATTGIVEVMSPLSKAPAEPRSAERRPIPRIKPSLMAELVALIKPRQENVEPQIEPDGWLRARPLPGVVPRKEMLAMDDALSDAITFAGSLSVNSAWTDGLAFPGFTYLAYLAQRPEYRKISGRIATEMTRKWIELEGVGDEEKEQEEKRERGEVLTGKPQQLGKDAPDDDRDGREQQQGEPQGPTEGEELSEVDRQSREDRIKVIEDELERMNVRDVFREMAEHDGYFGRAHLFFDFGDDDAAGDELAMPIGNGRNDVSRAKCTPQRPLRSVCAIEPMWCYPTQFQGINPLKKTWYNPEHWFVMGHRVHSSRLMRIVGREVPDILKPAYSFAGMSRSQMAKRYVDNWVRTQKSVGDLVSAFSTFIWQTDLSTMLSPGDGEIDMRTRVMLFNTFRDNRGTFLIDKNNEDIKNVSAPISGLAELQAQAQEQMGSVGNMPLVILLGITPTGLNASSEGELKVWCDYVESEQEAMYRKPLSRVIDFIQLSKFGSIDEGVRFRFKSLWSLNEKERAEVNKLEAETDMIYADGGIVATEEVRTAIAGRQHSPYAGIDPDDVPDHSPEEQAASEADARQTEAENAGKVDPFGRELGGSEGEEDKDAGGTVVPFKKKAGVAGDEALPAKIGRDTFLYMPAALNDKQCHSCCQYDPDGGICTILDMEVEKLWSCAAYIPGKYDGSKPAKRVTPEIVGLTKAEVRCEHCKYGGETCKLYDDLNKRMPEMFDLDSKIESKACCNAWTAADREAVV